MLDGPVSLDLPGQPVIFSFWPPDLAIDPAISRYTGKHLRRIRYELGVRGDDAHEQINTVLSAAAKGENLISDADGGRWEVTEHSFSWTDGHRASTYRHTVQLQEHEELDLQRVEFEGLTITPDRWKLEPDDHRISLWILAALNLKQHQEFERVLERREQGEESYFPVHMVGITSDLVRMRFGRCLWQPLEADVVRYRIVLVGEGGDDEAEGLFQSLHQPEINRLMEQSAITRTTLDALVGELQRAGALDQAAIDRIRSNSDLTKVPFTVQRDFDRTNQVDSFFD